MNEKTDKAWGHYIVNEEASTGKWKLKTLVVYPNKTLSYQQHKNRGEIWLVKEGKGTAVIGDKILLIKEGDIVNISTHQWHQLINGTNDILVIHEIQYGEKCEEEDIERYG
jgi:mannose-6-phosphate isomerase-like protein (cupin superfamily)